MNLEYTYKKTEKIEEYLQKLQVAKKVMEVLPRFPYFEENLRRQSLLKSSLFSARIEGNRLYLEEIELLSKQPKKDLAKIEVFNILKALHFIYSSQAPKKITKKFILKLHQIVLAEISPSAGYFRQEPSAIFNQAGIAVYLTPGPDEVLGLIKKMINKVNQTKDPGPVKAATFHFIFEKIHPFLDGNGRVGRLLSTFILKNSGFGFRGLVSPEEYLEKHRQIYYDLLLINKKDITEFVEFFLQAAVVQTEKTLNQLKNVKREKPEDSLLPRRKEILNLIKNHKLVSFDFLHRRFLKVTKSTLHYDLQQLTKRGFIRKLGATRGVLYTL
ncbi:MAG TPA: Fic family protein [Candidatus Bathyarchaeia archaeon]|nr:Fic family protein [Candidatus Bathyarchaeia archaeon]